MRRLAGSNALAAISIQCSTVLAQLISAPLLLSSWGVETYSTWLEGMALPLIMAYADLGLGAIIGYRLQSEPSAQNGRLLYSAGILSTAFISLSISGGASLAFLVAPWNPAEAPTQILLFFYGAGLAMHSYALAIARPTSASARVMYLFAACRITEVALMAVMVKAGVEPQFMALLLLLNSILWFLSSHVFILNRSFDWASIAISASACKILLPLLRPAAAAVMLPLGLALALQWPIFIAGASVSAASLVTFVSARTLCRFSFQAQNVLITAYWGRISGAILENKDAARAIYRRMIVMGFVISLCFAFPLVVLREEIFSLWLGGEILPGRDLLLLVIAGVISAGSWLVAALPFTCTARHSQYSYHYIFINAIAAIACYIYGISSVVQLAVAIAVTEFLMLIFVSAKIRSEKAFSC